MRKYPVTRIIPRMALTSYFNSVALTELFVLQCDVKSHVLEVIREIAFANSDRTLNMHSPRQCGIGPVKWQGDAQQLRSGIPGDSALCPAATWHRWCCCSYCVGSDGHH